MKNVSCISRAGCPSGKLSAVKLYQSVSISGPSAIEKPMSEKIAVISSITWLIGWIRPSAVGTAAIGSVTSTRSASSRAVSAASARVAAFASISAVTSFFSPLIAAPAALRSSAGRAPSVESSAETEPFLPRAATRTASMAASSCALSVAAAISERSWAIWASRDMVLSICRHCFFTTIPAVSSRRRPGSILRLTRHHRAGGISGWAPACAGVTSWLWQCRGRKTKAPRHPGSRGWRKARIWPRERRTLRR